MLFSRREQSQLAPSLTQRFSNKLGQYLVPSHPRDVQLKNKKTEIDIDACYALLGEKTENNEYKIAELEQQLEKIIRKYQKKTSITLKAEQIALAALKLDAEQHSDILRHRFFDQDFSDCTLFSKSPTSPLRLALLSDALNITHFSDMTAQPAATEFKACRHMLNVLLSEVSMQDLENYCRDLRESCCEAMEERGADTDALQSSWQLRMRYSHSTNSLLLKCMPIDMLRDTFQRQYQAQFGQKNPNADILIESLEVTMHCEDEVTPGAPTESHFSELFLKAWQTHSTDSELSWSKNTNKTASDNELAYLECPVLHKILVARRSAASESKVADFFIQKVEKDVDGNDIRN